MLLDGGNPPSELEIRLAQLTVNLLMGQLND